MLGEMAAEGARTWLAVEQPKDMARHLIQPRALGELSLDVRHEEVEHLETRRRSLIRSEQRAIDLGKEVRISIGSAAEHHAIHLRQLRFGRGKRLDPAIENDLELRPTRLQAMNPPVIEGRQVAVLLRAEAFEPSLARMHDEGPAACFGNGRDEPVEACFGVLVVDADAAFDRDWNWHRSAHRRDALGDKLRLRHEAGAEASRLHAARWAADIEIDLVITEVGADPRSLGKLIGIAAAELKSDRMLCGMKTKHAVAVAVEHCLSRHHLSVEKRSPRQQPEQVAAVAVGPLHHRRNGETV